MRKLGSKGWLAVVGVGLLLAMTCCEFRGNWSADLIEKALRRQPGVTFVSHSLRKEMGLELRAASFDVHVGPKVTAEKLASLTRTFSDHIHGSWVYGGLGATMTVMGTSESFPAQTGSTMYVSIAPSETPPDPPWQDWLTLSQGDYAY